MFQEVYLNDLNIRLESLERCLRRCDEVEVRFRNEMLHLYQCLKQKKKSAALKKLPKRVESTLLYKGKDLLLYAGDRSNFKEVGRYLARAIHTKDERQAICFSPRKTMIDQQTNRKPAPKSDVDNFKEAVVHLCGDSRFAYLRAKDAANQVGRWERRTSSKKKGIALAENDAEYCM